VSQQPDWDGEEEYNVHNTQASEAAFRQWQLYRHRSATYKALSTAVIHRPSSSQLSHLLKQDDNTGQNA